MDSELEQLVTGSNWELSYSQLKVAQFTSPTRYKPIPPFELPVTFISPILNVTAESTKSKARWWLGCRASMIIDIPGTAFEETIARVIAIPINRPFLLQLPRIAPQYRLRIDIPYWHEELWLKVWEYGGDVSTATEALVKEQSDLIRIDLLRIESKVDSL